MVLLDPDNPHHKFVRTCRAREVSGPHKNVDLSIVAAYRICREKEQGERERAAILISRAKMPRGTEDGMWTRIHDDMIFRRRISPHSSVKRKYGVAVSVYLAQSRSLRQGRLRAKKGMGAKNPTLASDLSLQPPTSPDFAQIGRHELRACVMLFSTANFALTGNSAHLGASYAI